MTKNFKNPQIKLLSFQKDLGILLEEYDYTMSPQLRITKDRIESIIAVNTKVQPPKPEEAKPKKNVKEKPSEAKN